MRYRVLGKTGLRVSELALGTMTFGDDWELPDDRPAKILERFAEAGGNVLDTSNEYGRGTAESVLGDLLQHRRDAFVLTTKYTLQVRPGDVNAAGNHRKNLVVSLEDSLRRLKTDHIDILWVHARDTLTPVAEVMRALDDQVRAGKVLYVGVSNWPAWEIAQANTLAEQRGWTPFAAMQVHYNLLDRAVENEFLPMAHAFDLPAFVWGPLADGRLTGKYLRGEEGRLNKVAWGRARGEGDDVVREVVRIAEELGRPPAQVALAWLRSRPGTVIPIIGATTEEQLNQNLGSVDVDLGRDHLAALDRATAIPAGYPNLLLRFPAMTRMIYGEHWQRVDDRRSTSRRAVTDDLFSTVD
ncbi:aldo/keto reductase [Streptomyces sp. NPDC093510]|uniref:aldo/keto reductase n=1 Tax=Streptomyces sp. NPDC093510 TaxID=3155199 RepID=UPI00343116CB